MKSFLTPPQEHVLALISAGCSITAAAQAADIHRNTVHYWVTTSSEFRIGLLRAREAKAFYWREQAEELASTAIETIRAILTDSTQPAAVRLKAAQSILALATTPVLSSATSVISCLPANAEPVPNSAQMPTQPPPPPEPPPPASPIPNPQLPSSPSPSPTPVRERVPAEPVHNSAQSGRPTPSLIRPPAPASAPSAVATKRGRLSDRNTHRLHRWWKENLGKMLPIPSLLPAVLSHSIFTL